MTTNGTNSFWKKPEGKTGMIFPILLAGVVFYFWGSIVPFVLATVKSTVWFVIYSGILLSMLYVAFDPKARALAGTFYRSLMRHLTKLFIDLDPIGVMKNYISYLKKNKEEVVSQMNVLRGVIVKLKNDIKENEKEKENRLMLSSQAQKSGDMRFAGLKASQAKLLENSNMSLNELLVKLNTLLGVLLKMQEASDYYLDDLTFKVDQAERERKSIKAGYSAMKKITKALLGDAQRELFEDAWQSAAEDYAAKIGEIEGFMDMTKNLIQSVELQKSADVEAGLNMLSEWETKRFALPAPKNEPIISSIPQKENNKYYSIMKKEK